MPCSKILTSLVIFLCCSGTWILADPPAGKTYTFTYRLKPGDAFTYQANLRIKGKAQIPGEKDPQPVEGDIQLKYRLEVKKVLPDGKYELEARLWALKVRSGSEEDPSASATLPPPLTLVIDRWGKLYSTQGMEALGNNIPLPGLNPFIHLFAMTLFPPKPVGEKDSWSELLTYPLPGSGKVEISRKISLVKVETKGTGEIATVRSESDLPLSLNITVPVPARITGRQRSRGESLFTLQTGMPEERKEEIEVDYSIVAQALPSPTGPTGDEKGQIQTKLNATVWIQLKRIPDEKPPPLPAPPPKETSPKS